VFDLQIENFAPLLVLRQAPQQSLTNNRTCKMTGLLVKYPKAKVFVF
jgi:hypothetical protein